MHGRRVSRIPRQARISPPGPAVPMWREAHVFALPAGFAAPGNRIPAGQPPGHAVSTPSGPDHVPGPDANGTPCEEHGVGDGSCSLPPRGSPPVGLLLLKRWDSRERSVSPETHEVP